MALFGGVKEKGFQAHLQLNNIGDFTVEHGSFYVERVLREYLKNCFKKEADVDRALIRVLDAFKRSIEKHEQLKALEARRPGSIGIRERRAAVGSIALTLDRDGILSEMGVRKEIIGVLATKIFNNARILNEKTLSAISVSYQHHTKSVEQTAVREIRQEALRRRERAGPYLWQKDEAYQKALRDKAKERGLSAAALRRRPL